MKTIVICAVSCFVLCLGTTHAQTITPVVSVSQFFQNVRIKQGYRSGELTEREANRLQKEQDFIRRKKLRAKMDGKITAKEYRAIRLRQRKANARIYRQKHDRQPP